MNISDSMLFRWVGYGIENPEDAKRPAPRRPELSLKANLTAEQRKTYMSYLGNALTPTQGLWVSEYNDADIVGAKSPICRPNPCLFFTEQSAGVSQPHWRRYGRLGFGFAKRFVFQRGGRPVIYTHGGSRDPLVRAISAIRRITGKLPSSSDQKRLGEFLELFAQHVKSTQLPRKQRQPSRKPLDKRKQGARKAGDASLDYPCYRPIPFLGEREWRLMLDVTNKARWRVAETPGKRGYWYPVEAGSELQVVIVPDNACLRIATDLIASLVPAEAVPVHVIAAQALAKL